MEDHTMVWRINGTQPFAPWRTDFDRAFGGLFQAPTAQDALPGVSRAYPAINAWEADDVYYVEAEVPGMSEGEIDVSVVGNQLTIRGERKGAASEGATFHRRERGAGEFVRSLRLPVAVETGRVEAQLRDGVLTLSLPKAESHRPRKIPIVTESGASNKLT
jgi:HSP20 family protein